MRTWGSAAGVLVVAAAWAASAQVPTSQRPNVTTSFPGVQPQLAKLGDKVFLVTGQDNVISVRSSTDGGQHFGPAATITVPGRVSLGMHRGPRIAVTRAAVMVTVVAGAKGGGADGDLLLFRSTDGGKTFASPAVINDVAGSPREGLHGMSATANGLAALAWLDLRGKGTRIYTAVSRDDGVSWSPDRLAYASPSGSVCECCHPSVAVNIDGAMAVMFRNNLDGNRDLYVARSRDWSNLGPPKKSGTGSWKLDACPMDGGALVLDGNDPISVWRRENDVYLAPLGHEEKRLGAGRDPVIDLDEDDHQDIAWSSASGIMLMRGDRRPALVGEGRFPAIVSLAQRTVVAWELQGTVKVVSLPR
jgi:hypothetical protein